MKALCWNGIRDVRVENVPDPKILNPRDAIVRITTTAICGSDLHLYDGYIPTMQKGDILGHEFMGEVVDVGHEVKNLALGDRVVVPFTISCGQLLLLRACRSSRCCDNSNPNAGLAETVNGHSSAGHLRLLAPLRRLRGGPGRIRPRPVRRRRADQDPRRHPGRAGPLPLRHLPDRLHGRRELQHPPRRHRGRLGMRPGRPVRHPQRLPARRRARHRHRPLSRAPPDGPRREGRGAQLRGGRRLRGAEAR